MMPFCNKSKISSKKSHSKDFFEFLGIYKEVCQVADISTTIQYAVKQLINEVDTFYKHNYSNGFFKHFFKAPLQISGRVLNFIFGSPCEISYRLKA